MEIEFTTGMITMLCSAGAFVLIALFLLIYLSVTSYKMKKILKKVEFDEDENDGEKR